MAENEEIQSDDEEVDLLAPAISSDEVEEEADKEAGQFPDLLDEADLKNVMATFNPLAMRDISTIEKGVEHYFLFNGSHRALIRNEQLQYLTSADIAALVDRNVVRQFEYIDYNSETAKIKRASVLIRPASLKAEQVAKVMRGCILGSVCAVLEWIADRDLKLAELEEEGELARFISGRFQSDDESLERMARLKLHLQRLPLLSFEADLENAGCSSAVVAQLSGMLQKAPADYLWELEDRTFFSDKCRQALDRRASLPMLLKLSPGWSQIQPSAVNLIEMKDGQIKEIRSELEWMHMLFVQLARQMLMLSLPQEETGWIDGRGTAQDSEYLNALRQHPSLNAGETWGIDYSFSGILESAIKEQKKLKKIRVAGLVEILMQEALKQMNMRFEPVLFNRDNFTVNKSISRMYSSEEDLYQAVLERLKTNPDVLKAPERRQDSEGGLYILYKINLPRAFIENKSRRNFLHLLARENGYEKGIYDFLRELRGGEPQGVVREQMDLTRAIRDWERRQEEEKRKQEKKAGGFFQKLINFFLGLFGMGEPELRQNRSDDQDLEGLKGRRGVLVGPREKTRLIPTRVQQAVDYVERSSKGLIWLDEVLIALKDSRQNLNSLGDMLFYDREGRYAEVRALISMRRLFISKQNEASVEWLQSTLDYLENLARPGPETGPLIAHLKKKLQDI